MQFRPIRIALAGLFLAVFPSAGAGPPWVLASPGNPPHYRPMPCPPRVQPDTVTASWHFQVFLRRPAAGRRVIRSAATVQHFYRSTCSLTLTWYTHPVSISCPSAASDDVYHFAFLRGGRPLLRIKEQVEGCTFIWVEGQPRLGSAWGTILPPGVPNPPLK
jgi:hypothetical protein